MSGCRRGPQNVLRELAPRRSGGQCMGKFGTMLQVGRTFGVRDGMRRLEYELQRGSGWMSWRMRSVQGWCSLALEGVATGVRAETVRAEWLIATSRVFF